MPAVKTRQPAKTRPLPDPPDKDPDDMTSFDHLTATSIIEPLRHRLGNPKTTLITGEKYLCPTPPARNLAGARYPDLLIAFNANLAAHRQSNGYIITEQGKPPDFVLEIASRRTGKEDTGPKRRDYARFGIPEYWRFDQTGEHHQTRLAADRLINGQYHPIPIRQLPNGDLQGYSPTLNLCLKWENGQLKWLDPQTGRPIPTFADERQARIDERQARRQAEARADLEARRARQLEAQLRRLRNQQPP